MINRQEFVRMVETDRTTVVSIVTSCALLTPGMAQEYEEALDHDLFYQETMDFFSKKDNLCLLNEAISLGITE